MARKLRLEYPGACYHVINRGNYRGNVFQTDSAKAAFETCLFEACAKSHWVLHAFVVMRNHFHLAIATPDGNLVRGMHWLEGTFATRFNRLRDERGHLFQGRYKALVAEDGGVFGLVSDYIHLNPVRAKIVCVPKLEDYRYSSYWYLRRPAARPAFLRLDLALRNSGEFDDTPDGWDSYRDYLAWQVEAGPAGRSKAYVSLSKGWVLGSADFQSALVKDHAMVATARAWESQGAREIRQQSWEAVCQRALRILGRKNAHLEAAPKAAAWKVAVAMFLKERSQASNRWIGERLKIGSAKYVSYLVSVAKRSSSPPPEHSVLRRQAT